MDKDGNKHTATSIIWETKRWRYWKDVVIPSWRMFSRAFPLFVFWLWIPLCLLLIRAVWRMRSAAVLAEGQALQTAVIPLPGPEGKSLNLYVSYPRKVLYYPTGTRGGVLALWLREATVTPNRTFTPVATNEHRSQEPSSTPTPSSTHYPTPTATPLVVSILAEGADITFVDERGLPLDSRVALTPSRFSVTPEVLYVRPDYGAGQQLGEASLRFALDGHPPPASATSVSLQVETEGQAKWRSLLGDTFGGVPALVGALLAVLVGFVVQQWQSLNEEDKQRQSVRKKIAQLLRQLECDPADGLRQLEKALQGSDPLWLDEWKKIELDRAFQNDQRVPPKLKVFFTLWIRRRETVDEYYNSTQVNEALKWALSGTLDDDWEQRAVMLARKPAISNLLGGEVMNMVEQRALQAVLKPWVSVTFWRFKPPSYSENIARGLRFLGLDANPFGAEQAEDDNLLFDGYYPHFDALREAGQDVPALVFGSSGAGKTAAALWLVRESLCKRERFPVYFPTTAEPLLPEIARAASQTLLSYLAVHPTEFTKLPIACRQVIVHLWAYYIGEGDVLIARLRETGLATTGPGQEIETEIRKRMKGLPASDTPTGGDLLRWLECCRPAGFDGLRLLIDWNFAGSSAAQERLSDLLATLTPFGIVGMVFLAGKAETRRKAQSSALRIIELQWTADLLKKLLEVRLKHVGEDSLVNWCDPLAAQTDPNERLVKAIATPAELIHKGNDLLSWIGEKGKKLSEEALDTTLGASS